LSGVLVYIAGGQRPPVTEITTECKPNLSLGRVLVYISGGQRPPGAITQADRNIEWRWRIRFRRALSGMVSLFDIPRSEFKGGECQKRSQLIEIGSAAPIDWNKIVFEIQY